MNFLDARLPLHFWDKVSPCPMSGCWLWTGASTGTGYGQVRIGGRKGKCTVAHRHAYTRLVGEVPLGLELDHLCSQRCCVNPHHLQPVTHLENIRRSSNAQKTHCTHGHEYTPENTVRDNGHRKCRTCLRARDLTEARRARKRKRAA